MMELDSEDWWTESIRRFRHSTLPKVVEPTFTRSFKYDIYDLTIQTPMTEQKPSSNATLLCEACLRGNVVAVRNLLEKHPSCINDRDKHGRPALLYAAEGFHMDQLACLYVLLDSDKCDVNVKDIDGEMAVMAASRVGGVSALTALLADTSIRINEVNKHGQTALHLAANKGCVRLSRVLILSGADLDIQDKLEGATALHFAATWNCVDVVHLLLEHGAKTNLQMNDRKTALHCACLARSFPLMRMLLDAGADVNSLDMLEQLPIHHVVSDENLVRYLVSNGSEVNGKGFSPLHYVCRRVGTKPDIDLEYVRFLLDSGADINAQINGRRPIDVAIVTNKTEVVYELLYRNCSIRRICTDKRYLLLSALINGNMTLVNLLYQVGARMSRERFDLWLQGNCAKPTIQMKSEVIDVLFNQPRTLQSISRIAIRSAIGTNIISKMEKLCLPTKLKDYILIKDLRLSH